MGFSLAQKPSILGFSNGFPMVWGTPGTPFKRLKWRINSWGNPLSSSFSCRHRTVGHLAARAAPGGGAGTTGDAWRLLTQKCWRFWEDVNEHVPYLIDVSSYIYIYTIISIYLYICIYIYICAYVCCMFFTYTNMVHWYTCTTSLQGITKSQSALAWSNGLEAKL